MLRKLTMGVGGNYPLSLLRINSLEALWQADSPKGSFQEGFGLDSGLDEEARRRV